MQEITGNELNTRLVSAPKLYTFNNVSGFSKDDVGSSVESYIRSLFYPDQGVMREIEYRGERTPVYSTSSLRLNYLASSSVVLTDSDFSTSTSNITASITDPFSSTGAINMDAGYVEMDTYQSISGSLYLTGWFRSDDVTEFYVNNITSSVDNTWSFKTIDITTSSLIDSVKIESNNNIELYEPRLYNYSQSLYASSLTTSDEYDTTGFMYHRSSSFNEAPNGIIPESFKLIYNETDEIIDDGGGNLVHDSVTIGNIFYEHGHIVVDDRFYFKEENEPLSVLYDSSSLVDITYNSNVEMLKTTVNFLLESDKYNYTINPTYESSSAVNPYFNYVELLNENNEVIMRSNISKNIGLKNDVYLILEILEDA
jgi:hypothetical protein